MKRYVSAAFWSGFIVGAGVIASLAASEFGSWAGCVVLVIVGAATFIILDVMSNREDKNND